MTRTTNQEPTVLSVTLDAPVREALALMNEEGLDALPVTGLGGVGVAGVVLRRGLERGCVGMDHDVDTCPVRNHVKRDVATVTRQEFESGAGSPAQSASPVVVVDEEGRPLHAIQGER